MANRLHHVAIIVSGEQSVAFYEKLGFAVTKRIPRPERHDEIVLMEGCGMTLELFIDSTHPARANDPENLGLRHIAFKVENIDALMSVFECEPIRTDWFGVRFTFTKDPDGLPIELHE